MMIYNIYGHFWGINEWIYTHALTLIIKYINLHAIS